MPEDRLAEFRNHYPVTVDIPVAWGDMDALGHVNNIVYFRYFETARMALFEQVEFGDPERHAGMGPILASTDCRFRIPLEYPDTVTAAAWVEDVESDRFVMRYALFSHGRQGLAAEGSGRIVSYDYGRNCKAPLPDAIRLRLLDLALRD
ncbi:MAG: acyl-CoA thioesterase [Chromatiales bacterium]|jgi:acyl-CoA thioester hydrolase|nr:acyl-CoA thioesterase [Chromatiales bacterium]